MKTLRIFSLLMVMAIFSLIEMSFTHPVTGGDESSMALLPDLKVSAIATPGGLCKGTASKVRVSITNSQMAGTSENIPVILFVSQSGEKPTSYVAYLEGGIGPNANSGQPVWFNNVTISATNKAVTLKAVVNPDQEILESVYNNNTKIINARVSKVCGETVVQAATLTVYAYNDGTWQGGSSEAVSGASVTVTKGSQTFTGTTGDDGKAAIANVPSGGINIAVTKQGYKIAKRYMVMSSYPSNTNMAMVLN